MDKKGTVVAVPTHNKNNNCEGVVVVIVLVLEKNESSASPTSKGDRFQVSS